MGDPQSTGVQWTARAKARPQSPNVLQYAWRTAIQSADWPASLRTLSHRRARLHRTQPRPGMAELSRASQLTVLLASLHFRAAARGPTAAVAAAQPMHA